MRASGEGGLVWAIGASGLAHGAVLAFLALTPSRFEGMSTLPESYSVELVAPSAVGGTNLPGSPGPKIPAEVAPAAPPLPAASKSAPGEEPPLPVNAAEPAAKPPPPAKPQEAKKAKEAKNVPAAKKDVPKKAEVKEEKAVALPSVADSAKPDKKKPPRPEEQAREAKKSPPEKPQAKAKAEAKKDQPSEGSREKDTKRDQEIAAAVQRRAASANSGSGAKAAEEEDLDRRIAAAVQRRAMDAARAGTGIGGSDSTVASVGPGSGVGGAVRGIEYVMYRNRMESRIKAAWVWAGADRSLRSVVRFNVTPEGKIINVQTVQPSGDTSYDASVERAIRAADPLGPPPEQYRDEFGTVELEFRAEDAKGG